MRLRTEHWEEGDIILRQSTTCVGQPEDQRMYIVESGCCVAKKRDTRLYKNSELSPALAFSDQATGGEERVPGANKSGQRIRNSVAFHGAPVGAKPKKSEPGGGQTLYAGSSFGKLGVVTGAPRG